MEPRFEPLASTSGLAIIDPIEKRRFSLLTPEVVSQTPSSVGDFHFPVSSACSIRTSEIELPYTVSLYVRDTDGTMITNVEPPADIPLPRNKYLIELSSPVKLYLQVETELAIEASTENVRLLFDEKTTVTVGARSRHESPAGTVTVPDEPEGMMAGLSALSSSLKTTSPERSFPTLRGHPPRIKRGECVAIPDDFARPDTNVSIEVPPKYEKLYPVVPLAFYLGAQLIPGEAPCLRTDTGFEYQLDSQRGFEQEVERVLKQSFFLDCIVRTEGYYPIRLAEREQVESRLDFDFDTLYDAPLSERVEQYLDIPYETIEDAVPTWHRVTFIRPEAENVDLLPYVVNDLSLVRNAPEEESIEVNEEMTEVWEGINEFHRSPSSSDCSFFRGIAATEYQFTRTDGYGSNEPSDRNYITMPKTDAIEQAWVGEGIPTSGTKLLPTAYEHEQPMSDDGVIDVTVVCNDTRMRREWDMVSKIYGSRDDIPLEANVEFGLGKDDLRKLLKKPTDLFHYIGHVDERGFDCIDGFLDAETLNDVGMKAFLLNACHSHSQGEALIESGASAGIVSLSEVGNRSAMEFGETLLKLFYHGFSVGTALNLVGEYTTIGSRYIGLGDIGLILTQNKNNNTLFYKIDGQSGQQISVSIYSYPNRDHPIGSITTIFLLDEKKQYLQPVRLTNIKTTKSEFEDLMTQNVMPIIAEEQLTWSDQWVSE